MLTFLRRPSLRLFAVGLISTALVALLAPQNYWDRMKTMVTGKELHAGQSLSNRARLQQAGLKILFNNPLIGVGPGNFSQAYFAQAKTESQLRSSANMAEGKTFAVAHNMYLEFFAENGIPGGLLFLSLFILSIRQLLRFDRLAGVSESQPGLGFSLSLALGGMLFAGLFLSQGKNSVLWFMVGVGCAMGSVISRKRSSAGDDFQLTQESSSMVLTHGAVPTE